MELVQEIFQVLIDKEETCHRTCFTLQLDGATMDNFAELKNIEGLTEGSTIKVVEGTSRMLSRLSSGDVQRGCNNSFELHLFENGLYQKHHPMCQNQPKKLGCATV